VLLCSCVSHPMHGQVEAFTNKTGKFAIKGYPNKLGFLLHGPPGACRHLEVLRLCVLGQEVCFDIFTPSHCVWPHSSCQHSSGRVFW
jgi:hypothetical protein